MAGPNGEGAMGGGVTRRLRQGAEKVLRATLEHGQWVEQVLRETRRQRKRLHTFVKNITAVFCSNDFYSSHLSVME